MQKRPTYLEEFLKGIQDEQVFLFLTSESPFRKQFRDIFDLDRHTARSFLWMLDNPHRRYSADDLAAYLEMDCETAELALDTLQRKGLVRPASSPSGDLSANMTITDASLQYATDVYCFARLMTNNQ